MLQSINPATGEKGQRFKRLTGAELEAKLEIASAAFVTWRKTPIPERSALLGRIADQFEAHRDKLARTMTFEMGKPIKAALAEVDKCTAGFRFYAEHGPAYVADKPVEWQSGKALIRRLPIGPVLAVMPWNFPYWQVVRFLAPALMAGNAGLLKHASNVPACAHAIEDMVRLAGAPEGLFQNLFLASDRIAGIIADDRVAAVTLTGSEGAGMSVAEAAGRALKKVVLELGGSDPFIVMPSADVEKAAGTAVQARIMNSGQSCICAKRMIVHADVYDRFMARFAAGMKAVKLGDPLDPATDMGPMSSLAARDDIAAQLERAVRAGATKLMGGEALPGPGAFFTPAILVDIPPDAPVAREEFFGPVAMVFKVASIDEAIARANDVPFGLGSSVWTNDEAERQRFINEIEAGMTAINQMLASDPHVPFGGIKRSGHGRELAAEGLHEFTNLKTVFLPNP